MFGFVSYIRFELELLINTLKHNHFTQTEIVDDSNVDKYYALSPLPHHI